MTLTTTLADIRAAKPCDNFSKICDHFGVTSAQAKTHTEPFPVALLLETNDLEDTLWVLENVTGSQRLCRLFAADCAERVLHIFEAACPGDTRPRDAIAVARDANATSAEIDAARDAARAAERDAADAARAAAGAAAWAARNKGKRHTRIEASWAAQTAARSDAERGEAYAPKDAAAGDEAAAEIWAAMESRLRQYLEHGEAAAGIPWEDAK